MASNLTIPDNHDAGDLLSDVEFITKVANGTHFDIDFPTAVITKYCVQHNLDDAFADYVSCNGGDTEHYTCLCNNLIDRCIGRLDTSPCVQNECHCTDESLNRSQHYIGRMPVYAPFPSGHGHGSCTAPPVEQSTFLGYWYSFPASAECTPITGSMGDGRGSAEGCSWARGASQRLVRGATLSNLGFNLSSVCDVPQLLQNRDVIAAALAAHPARCCGC